MIGRTVILYDFYRNLSLGLQSVRALVVFFFPRQFILHELMNCKKRGPKKLILDSSSTNFARELRKVDFCQSSYKVSLAIYDLMLLIDLPPK
jgi:hypothetical protein